MKTFIVIVVLLFGLQSESRTCAKAFNRSADSLWIMSGFYKISSRVKLIPLEAFAEPGTLQEKSLRIVRFAKNNFDLLSINEVLYLFRFTGTRYTRSDLLGSYIAYKMQYLSVKEFLFLIKKLNFVPTDQFNIARDYYEMHRDSLSENERSRVLKVLFRNPQISLNQDWRVNR